MCHRFQQIAKQKALAEYFRITSLATEDVKEFDEKDRFPLLDVFAIRQNDNDHRELISIQWGFIPSKWKPTKEYTNRKKYQRQRFNARSEAVHQTWAYRDAFRTRRAIIPATTFFEHGHYFGLADRPIFAFAGLWDRWESEGETVESCTILTTEASELVANVHPRKRMPVILDCEDDWALWLNPDISERQPLETLFKPYDPDRMTIRTAE